MNKLTFTTTNKWKLKAAQIALEKYNIEIEGVDIEVPEIQTDDVVELIKDKVRKYYEILKTPVVAMDSGLFINGLNGFPGVNTKFAGSTIKEDGLMALLRDIDDKSAYVQRTIGYTDGSDVQVFISRGYGEIINEKRGDNGYFYDFIFYIPEEDKTLAELTEEEKTAFWGDSWDQLAEYLLKKESKCRR